jgi:hypothetical protein
MSEMDRYEVERIAREFAESKTNDLRYWVEAAIEALRREFERDIHNAIANHNIAEHR